jgi:hypothetical protein
MKPMREWLVSPEARALADSFADRHNKGKNIEQLRYLYLNGMFTCMDRIYIHYKLREICIANTKQDILRVVLDIRENK